MTELTKILITATDQATPVFRQVQGSVERLHSSYKSFAALLAGGVGIGAFTALLKGAIDTGDELNKLSQKTGITVSDLSKLKYAGDLSGVSTEALAKGVKNLSEALVAASDRTSKQANLFRVLGVDIEGGPQKALLKLADTFSTLRDGEVKTALATEIFKKTGLDMIPFLNQGAEGLRKMMEEAERLGLVMSGETAKAAEQFNDNLKAVKASSEGLGISLLNSMAPALVRISDAMKQAAQEGGVLKAVWIGLGGVLAETLGLNDDPAVKRIREVSKEIADLQEKIAKGPKDLGDGVQDRSFINQYKLRVAELRDELRGLQVMQDALAGKFDDQASRRARQGQVLGGGGASESAIRNALANGGKPPGFFENELARAQKALAVAQAEAANGADKLTVSEKRLLEVVKDPEWAKLTPAQQARIKGTLEEASGVERATVALQQKLKAEMELLAIDEQTLREIEDMNRAGDQRILQLQEEVDRYELEVSVIGKTNLERELELLYYQKKLALKGTILDDQQTAIKLKYDELEAWTRVREQKTQDLAMWSQMGDAAGRFFSDLVDGGKSAFDNLKRWVRELFKEMLALFVKRWVLNLAAGGTFLGSAGSAFAESTGGGAGSSLLGTGLSMAGNYFLGGSTAVGSAYGAAQAGYIAQGAYLSGAAEVAPIYGTIAGEAGGLAASGSGMMAGLYETLATIPVWGWIAAAVIAVAAWLGGRHKGGPKVGGSFMGGFSGTGDLTGDIAVPGSDNGRFFTPNQGDSVVKDLVTQWGRGFGDTLKALGGTSGGFNFGLGFDHDPNGTAQSRVSALLTDANGNVLYRQQDREMDDKAVPEALQLEAHRALLVALQNSELPKEIADILNSVVASGASEEDIQRVIAAALEMKGVLDGLAKIQLKGLDVAALKAWQIGTESIGQTFARVAQQWADFQNIFLTDDQKLVLAWDSITKVFDDLGLSVPESNQAFLDLVNSLDLSTEAGRRMWDALHDVAPVFAQVEAAVTGMVNGIIENLRGPLDPQAGLSSELDKFMQNNPWTQGMTRDAVMAALLTITPEDAAAYIRAGQGGNLSAIASYYAAVHGGGGGGAGGGPTTAFDQDSLGNFVQAARDAAKALEDLRAGLRDWLDNLLLDSNLSPLDPMERLAEAQKQYQKVLGLAQGGDVGAMGQLSGSADTYLRIAREVFASSSAYVEIFRQVFDQVSGVAGGQDYNTRMLDIQQRSVSLQEAVANTLERIRQESREDAVYIADVTVAAINDVKNAIRDTATVSADQR